MATAYEIDYVKGATIRIREDALDYADLEPDTATVNAMADRIAKDAQLATAHLQKSEDFVHSYVDILMIVKRVFNIQIY